MKRIFTFLTMYLPLLAFAQIEAKTDSISATLDEVTVVADKLLETSGKTIIRPTKQEKRHSTNGYALLENINLPDFNVNANSQSVTTADGRNVIILINGVEAQGDELATLAASEIVTIDYRRNPGGKYVGNGAVINFITFQYDYGGNVYLSADEGLARQYGNYIGMANYKKDANILTVTANGKWDNSSQLNSATNYFTLNDGTLYQTIRPVENITQKNSQFLNLKYANVNDNHSFDVALSCTRSANPENRIEDDIHYSGLYDFQSSAIRFSREKALSPALKTHYNLYLPGGHTLMAIGTLRYGHTDYRSEYLETDVGEIQNNTIENSILTSTTLGYFKSMANGLTLGVTLDEYLTYYHDAYSGNYSDTQTLTNNTASAIFHIDQNLPWGLSYYASLGMYDLYSTIGNHADNQISPKLFYGASYIFNRKHSVSLTGNYVHSLYNPSDKNDARIRTSFFETTIGNPDIEQVKAFQNIISYNGRTGRIGITASYDYLKYYGNTSYRYFAEGNVMYRQLVNDGNFVYHKFNVGLTADFFGSRLRLKGNAMYSMNRFESEYRPVRSNDWRFDFSASYIFCDWQIRGVYALPYRVLGIEGVKFRNPTQYGLTVNWQKGNWSTELNVENFLHHRYRTESQADYIAYRSTAQSLGDLKGRNISLTLTYMLPYGKKTEKERIQTESSISSAILRPF